MSKMSGAKKVKVNVVGTVLPFFLEVLTSEFFSSNCPICEKSVVIFSFLTKVPL